MGLTFKWPVQFGRSPTLNDVATESMIGGMHMSGSLTEICKVLETFLGRVFIDETELSGFYDINIADGERTLEGFSQVLRDRYGLVLTPGRRDVLMLVAHSNAGGPAAL